MTIKKHIPNLLTLLNLFSGCVAVVLTANHNFLGAFWMVSLGIFFDFFDGFFARLFKVAGPLGLQLDSLADMVTSGVVPGFVMFQLLSATGVNPYVPYLGFIITVGSCYRLANFNIDTRQTSSFIGLPTPANTLFIMSLPLVLSSSDSILVLEVLTNPFVLLAITFFSAFVMNTEMPLFSLKIKSFQIKDNLLQFGFLASSLVLLALLHYIGIPLVILLYISLSMIANKFKSAKE